MTAIAIPRRRILYPGLSPRLRDWMLRFMPPFGRVFQPPMATAGGVAIPALWPSAGGTIAPAHYGAWRAKGAVSLAASYLNIGLLGSPNIDPAVVGTGVDPTWLAGFGWTFNGVNQWLNTGAIHGQNWSMIVQIANHTNFNIPCGALDITQPSVSMDITPNSGGSSRRYELGGWGSIGGGVTSGILAVAGLNGYFNGFFDIALTAGAWSGVNGIEMGLGAMHGPGWCVAYYAGDILAFAIYDLILTGPQIMTIGTDMAAPTIQPSLLDFVTKYLSSVSIGYWTIGREFTVAVPCMLLGLRYKGFGNAGGAFIGIRCYRTDTQALVASQDGYLQADGENLWYLDAPATLDPALTYRIAVLNVYEYYHGPGDHPDGAVVALTPNTYCYAVGVDAYPATADASYSFAGEPIVLV